MYVCVLRSCTLPYTTIYQLCHTRWSTGALYVWVVSHTQISMRHGTYEWVISRAWMRNVTCFGGWASRRGQRFGEINVYVWTSHVSIAWRLIAQRGQFERFGEVQVNVHVSVYVRTLLVCPTSTRPRLFKWAQEAHKMIGKTQQRHCEMSFGTHVLVLGKHATTFPHRPSL